MPNHTEPGWHASIKLVSGISLLFILVLGSMFLYILLLPQPATEKNPNVSTEGITINGDYEEVTIDGETASNGVFDVSLEYDESGEIGWMAYTAVEFPYCHTHLAKTTDHGETWTYVLNVNPAIDGSITYNNITIEGVWINEVSTLVHDPDDLGKEWKLFWHKYFFRSPYNPSEDRMFQYGWIAYKYASNPEGPWSEEIPLFGGLFPISPYNVEHNLNQLHPDLKNIVAYTEPGSLVKGEVLYLSLQACTGNPINDKTILISSHDHGDTWEYVGTLTNYNDAVDLGYPTLTASSLAEEDNRVFLLSSPMNELHNGTYIFEFENISQAKLKRDETGKLIVLKYFKPSLTGLGHAGMSDYDAHNTYGGVLICQVDLSNLPNLFFQIFNTKVSIGNLSGSIAVIGFDPAACEVNVSDVFTINLTISNVSDLYSWVVTIEWNASLMELQGYEEGPFLRQGGSTTIIDNGTQPGKITELSCKLLGEVSGVDGSGTLVTFTFKAIAEGTTPINITFSDLQDSKGENINHYISNGTICP